MNYYRGRPNGSMQSLRSRGDLARFVSGYSGKLIVKAAGNVTLDATPFASGTTPPALTLSGTLTGGAFPHVQIDGAGDESTATHKTSYNDGSTFPHTARALSPAGALPGLGAAITATFAAGTYATDNVYRPTVASVADRSGAGNTATGAATRKPIVLTNAFNGRPGFRGSLARNTKLSLTGIALSTEATLVVVATASSDADTYFCSDSANLTAIISKFSGDKVEWFNNTERQTLLTTPGAGVHVYVVTKVNGGALVGYADGAQAFSTTSTVDLGTTFTSLMNGHNVTSGATADFYAFAVFNKAMPADIVRRVSRALMNEVGLAA